MNQRRQRLLSRNRYGKQNQRLNAMNSESDPTDTNTSESDNDSEYAFSVKTAQSSTGQTDNHTVN